MHNFKLMFKHKTGLSYEEWLEKELERALNEVARLNDYVGDLRRILSPEKPR